MKEFLGVPRESRGGDDAVAALVQFLQEEVTDQRVNVLEAEFRRQRRERFEENVTTYGMKPSDYQRVVELETRLKQLDGERRVGYEAIQVARERAGLVKAQIRDRDTVLERLTNEIENPKGFAQSLAHPLKREQAETAQYVADMQQANCTEENVNTYKEARRRHTGFVALKHYQRIKERFEGNLDALAARGQLDEEEVQSYKDDVAQFAKGLEHVFDGNNEEGYSALEAFAQVMLQIEYAMVANDKEDLQALLTSGSSFYDGEAAYEEAIGRATSQRDERIFTQAAIEKLLREGSSPFAEMTDEQRENHLATAADTPLFVVGYNAYHVACQMTTGEPEGLRSFAYMGLFEDALAKGARHTLANVDNRPGTDIHANDVMQQWWGHLLFDARGRPKTREDGSARTLGELFYLSENEVNRICHRSDLRGVGVYQPPHLVEKQQEAPREEGQGFVSTLYRAVISLFR